MKRPSMGIILFGILQILAIMQPFLFTFESVVAGFFTFFVPGLLLVFIGGMGISLIKKRLRNEEIIYCVLGGMMMFLTVSFCIRLGNYTGSIWQAVVNILYTFSVFACGIGLLRLNKYAMFFSVLFAPLRVALDMWSLYYLPFILAFKPTFEKITPGLTEYLFSYSDWVFIILAYAIYIFYFTRLNVKRQFLQTNDKG